MKRQAVGAAYSADLFEIPHQLAQLPGSMDFRPMVSGLMSSMLSAAAKAGMDRHEIAARASRLSGHDVSKAMLDGYTAESREAFNVPLWVAPVLEIACQSTVLGSWHASVHGGRLLVGAETLDAEIGRLMREREQADNRLRELKDLRRRVR
ncbi:MAG: hypothetical protein ACYCZD_12965 [Rhodanobacter sp.]